ncbi:MAG: hypothetical protein V4538_00865 [Bacteroidota bacterium]
MENKNPKKAVDSFPAQTKSNSEVTTSSLHLSYLTKSTEELTELILASKKFDEVKVIISFMKSGVYSPGQVLNLCAAFLNSEVLKIADRKDDDLVDIEKRQIEDVNDDYDNSIRSGLIKLIEGANRVINYVPVQPITTNVNSLFGGSEPYVKPSFTEADKVKMYNQYIYSHNESVNETKNSFINALQEGKTMEAPFYKAYLDYLVYTNGVYDNFPYLVVFLARSARDFSFYPLDQVFINHLGRFAWRLESGQIDECEFVQFSEAISNIGIDEHYYSLIK